MKFLKLFKKYVSPDFISKVSNSDEVLTFETKDIEYVLLFVDGNSPEEVNEIISFVIENAIEFKGILDTISSNFISIIFNIPTEIENPREKRLEFIKALISNKSKLSIVHGASKSSVGNIGNEFRMNYTALIPNYKNIMKELSMLDYGEVKRLDEKN